MKSKSHAWLPVIVMAISAIALGLAAIAPGPASAQDSGDNRLVKLVYDEAAVVTIRGRVKVQTTIKFAEDEAIENVAIGDSDAWQVQPNKAQSILFVKPLAPAAKTNMTVVTNKRTYLFDLVASPRSAPLYVLEFQYPELEKAKEQARIAAESAAEQEAEERASDAELAAATDPYAVQDPAALNFAWARSGPSDLLPERAYDNGEAVFLTWPAGTAIPAILVTNEAGEEGPVNFTVRGETVVLDRVPAQIILRSGDDRATLVNEAPIGPGSRSAAMPARAQVGS